MELHLYFFLSITGFSDTQGVILSIDLKNWTIERTGRRSPLNQNLRRKGLPRRYKQFLIAFECPAFHES